MNNISPCQSLQHPLFKHHNVTVTIKRDDLLHPQISGNKWRKLSANLQYAKQAQYHGIISFGGSYSNHLHALAYACQQYQLANIAIVRGEPSHASNATLSQISEWGAQLQFVDRQTYRLHAEPTYLAELQTQYPNYLIVPEGGSNALALVGVAELISELRQQSPFDYLLLPVASGGTFAGIIEADQQQHQLLGIAVLRQAEYLNESIRSLLSATAQRFQNWQLLTEFHAGGYAKFNPEHIQQMLAFKQLTNLPIEPIYSGKMVLALLALINQGHFPAHSRIMLLHTGGLQGLRGLAEQQRINISQWQ